MEFVPLKSDHISEMMTWFNNKKELQVWGSKSFRFPYTFDTFKEDMQLDKLSSYAGEKCGKVIAFGQIYQRLGKCHFARLLVAPNSRSMGIGNSLIKQLAGHGAELFGKTSYSLFIDNQNPSAFKLYRSLGFELEEYPGEIPSPGCKYMVKKGDF